MAVEYFCAYHSYLDALEQLTDAERGRLFTACLEYSKLGATSHLSGNERFVFPVIRGQIDRDKAAYQEKCETNRANASKKSDGKRSQAMAPKEKEKEKENEKKKENANAKESVPPFPPAQRQDQILDGLPRDLLAALERWVSYRRGKGNQITEEQLRSLSQVAGKYVERYSSPSVCALIDECISSGWKTIVWERLDKRPEQYGYQRSHMDEDFMNAIRRMTQEDQNSQKEEYQ